MNDFKAGDAIRYKLRDGSAVRTNGALDMTLEYYGPERIVYSWTSRNPARTASGEQSMTRAEFDRSIEAVPNFFEPGKTYKYAGLLFECTQVLEDSAGPVALGRESFARLPGNFQKPEVHLALRREFDNWSEA